MSERYNRQSFLGDKAQLTISTARVAVIGLGGGGSHVVQQLAHVGFEHYILLDPDRIKDVNLNRSIGATEGDVKDEMFKVAIATRVIRGLLPDAIIEARPDKWQARLDTLKSCDLIFGCVDGFIQRRDLETFARRFMIPYIDIGMDIHCIEGAPPRIAGQVILSMPGYACMNCFGFLNKIHLAREGAAYGDAGTNAQVVWCNGVLASTAVGIAIDLLTDWSKSLRRPIFLSYDGNRCTTTPDNRLEYLHLTECSHYPLTVVGEPDFRML